MDLLSSSFCIGFYRRVSGGYLYTTIRHDDLHIAYTLIAHRTIRCKTIHITPFVEEHIGDNVVGLKYLGCCKGVNGGMHYSHRI